MLAGSKTKLGSYMLRQGGRGGELGEGGLAGGGAGGGSEGSAHSGANRERLPWIAAWHARHSASRFSGA